MAKTSFLEISNLARDFFEGANLPLQNTKLYDKIVIHLKKLVEENPDSTFFMYPNDNTAIFYTMNWCYPENDVELYALSQESVWLLEEDMTAVVKDFAWKCIAHRNLFKKEWVAIVEELIKFYSDKELLVVFEGNDTDCHGVVIRCKGKIVLTSAMLNNYRALNPKEINIKVIMDELKSVTLDEHLKSLGYSKLERLSESPLANKVLPCERCWVCNKLIAPGVTCYVVVHDIGNTNCIVEDVILIYE